jgi:hypothetical protein
MERRKWEIAIKSNIPIHSAVTLTIHDGGTNYGRANRIANRELLKRAKALVGLTGVRGKVDHYGDTIEFRPYKMCTVLFVTFIDE